MPESVRDRPTKAHEYLFLLSKSERYYYDAVVIREDGPEYRVKEPDGWDTEPGAHNTIHRNGRSQGRTTSEIRSGRNRRSVWSIATQPFPEAHFAVMPEALVEPCVLAGCPVGGTVLDPFTGSGTVGVVACRYGREFVGIELNPQYVAMAERRIAPWANQVVMSV
jgi:site-specific DNA-methyltransferase (cytosine-N4-specific)